MGDPRLSPQRLSGSGGVAVSPPPGLGITVSPAPALPPGTVGSGFGPGLRLTGLRLLQEREQEGSRLATCI